MRYKEAEAIVFDYGATLDTNGVHWYNIFLANYERIFPRLNQEKLREAYIYGERALSKQRLISHWDSFRTTLVKKVELQSDYLINMGIVTKAPKGWQDNIVDNCYGVAKFNTERVKVVLSTLASDYRLALVSNFYGNLEVVLREFGLRDFFCRVSECARVGYSKPAPEIYLHCLRGLNLRANYCVMVGDSYAKDIVPTKQLGFHTVWLKGQGWRSDEKQSDLADEVIYGIEELCQKGGEINIRLKQNTQLKKQNNGKD